MAEQEQAVPADEPPGPGADAPRDDVDAVTHAVLTASRLLVAISARSLTAVEDRVTLPQFRLLVVLASHGDAKLVVLAERLGVNPSTAMRMLDRLIAAGLAERRTNPGNRRETVLRVTPEGSTLVDDVTAARRREIAAIVERLAPDRRTALVEALTAFTAAGSAVGTGTSVPGEGPEAYPLGWTSDPPARRGD
ncbi:MarR family winged helix-turn-helix transcriptional regulator [Streptomyces sp. AM 4-1-1]|uniref:MarR family winged helix-turn-helix transcriptional regulator n=1 Tax=unclassified Streptomyces TaxID=2593676 RepID=UPI0023BA38AE|nr:MarR family winged helix-turn-helix transcriptional regulator [Streptomyces sp. AM 4-1-1]WEH34698.1 MarR family winged helix-turn-helix transcriptional regulator [Streptomyces sp. AM 4-1-1]